MSIFSIFAKNLNIMELRIKEICKEKGLLLKDLAEKIGIAKESLTRIIKGNPQLSTLENIAKTLDVEINDLFYKSNKEITGFIEYDNKVYKINNRNDLKNFMNKVEIEK
jgi:transcriptional regulator with XRE-family HTH domain